jgi:hypothetical protein
VPFDPVSARYAQEHDIEVAIMGGDVIANVTDYLDSQQFTGTRITTS